VKKSWLVLSLILTFSATISVLTNHDTAKAYTQGTQPSLCTPPSDLASIFTGVYSPAMDSGRAQLFYQSQADFDNGVWTLWSVDGYDTAPPQITLSNDHITINGGTGTRSTATSNPAFFLGGVTSGSDVTISDVHCIGYIAGETYAESWTGSHLSGSEQTTENTYYPIFSASIANKDVTLKYEGPICLQNGQWAISQSDDVGGTTQISDFGPLSSPHTFEVANYSDYLVTLDPEAQPPFATPDCGDQYEFYKPTSMTIHVDGSTYTINSSTGADCTNTITGSVCLSKDDIKDCSMYGVDNISELVMCNVDNMGRTIKKGLIILFVPNSQHITDSFNGMYIQLQDSLGFLWYPFQFIQDFFHLVIDDTADFAGSNCDIGGISIFGSAPASIRVCDFKDDWIAYISIARLFAQGMISIALIRMFYSKLSGIIGGGGSASDNTDFDDGRAYKQG